MWDPDNRRINGLKFVLMFMMRIQLVVLKESILSEEGREKTQIVIAFVDCISSQPFSAKTAE